MSTEDIGLYVESVTQKDFVKLLDVIKIPEWGGVMSGETHPALGILRERMRGLSFIPEEFLSSDEEIQYFIACVTRRFLDAGSWRSTGDSECYHSAGSYRYRDLPDGSVAVIYSGCDTAEIIVPEELDGKRVSYIDKCCFFGDEDITSVTLPDGVSGIGEEAFGICRKLTKITFPQSILRIGAYAFRDCSSLSCLHMPPLVEALETGTFTDCENLGELILPNALKSIGGYAFNGCGNLKRLELPVGVTDISLGAFYSRWGFAPKIITALPREERWFERWPYGEIVCHKTRGIGTIIKTHNYPQTLTIDFNGGEEEFFYPNDFGESLKFNDPQHQERAEGDIEEQTQENIKLYNMWQRGLL